MKLYSRYTLRALLFAVVAGSSFNSLADSGYYRWLDSQGNPILSDVPPPEGTDYEMLGTQSFSEAAASQAEAAQPDSESTVDSDITQDTSAASGKYEKDSELCQIARTDLDTLTNSENVKTRNELGEERFMTPEEMEVGRQTVRAKIDVYCE